MAAGMACAAAVMLVQAGYAQETEEGIGSRNEACAMLGDPAMREKMSSGLERKLMVMCGEVKALSRKITPKRACALLENPERRANMSDQLAGQLVLRCGELNAVEPAPPLLREMPGSGGDPVFAGQVGTADRLINVGDGYIQSETTLASSPSGVLCAAWNDSGEYAPDGIGFTGFGSSSDGGVTWTDGGGFPPGPGGDSDFGDPSLAYSVRDGAFYFAALSVNGLSLWKSTNNCTTFTYVGVIAFGFGHDKELIAVDNNPASAYYGRIYAGWTNFFRFKDLNVAAYSDDGGVKWSSEIPMPGSGFNGQGMWPAVAPDGDIYFSLVNRSNVVGGFQDQWIYRSTNGGVSWVKATSIGTGQLRPENVAASNNCGRQALKGEIRNLSSPQIAIHGNAGAPAGYIIHAIYPYDSDGAGADNSNAFYRRSTDGGTTWSAERKLNDDTTTTDQFYPTLNVSAEGRVVASWYDRRLDPSNVNFGRYITQSKDGGLTWSVNERIGDVESPVAETLPNFDPNVANCYHGDYDQLVVTAAGAYIVWSDDRRITATGPNPDVYFDRISF